MSKKIGYAVIGYGGMGHFHGRRCQSIDMLDFIGFYDIDPEVQKKGAEEGEAARKFDDEGDDALGVENVIH